MKATSTRVNLAIPLDMAIQIEKDCDKRGIARPQYIKEAVYEKLKKGETRDVYEEINKISTELSEVKKIMMLILDNINKKNQL